MDRSTAPASYVALDVRMWRHSGIGSYLRGLTDEFARLDSPPRLACLGPRALAAEVAAKHAAWKQIAFNAPVYSLREQFFRPSPSRPGEEWALFHAPHYSFPLSWPHSRPLIVTIHDLIHLESPNPLKRAYARYFLRRLAARPARNLRVIVGSQATRRRLIEQAPGLTEEVVRLVPYGGLSRRFVESSPAPEAVASWRESRALPPEYVLMVGIALPHKNHDFAVRVWSNLAAKKQAPATLVLCGKGQVEAAKRYRRDAAQLSPSVEIVGLSGLRDEEMPFLYAGASLLVFPSLVEGFGLPVVEAQSMGVPVVASDRPAPREAGGNAAVHFDPTDEKSLAKAIRSVLSNPKRRDDVVRRGRERTKGMTWARAAMQTSDIYRELAGDAVIMRNAECGMRNEEDPRPDPLPEGRREEERLNLVCSPGFSLPVRSSRVSLYSDAQSGLSTSHTRPPFFDKRVALVHDWLNGRRGGESVLEELCAFWPLAYIHTLFYEPHRVSDAINRHAVRPSILQGFPRSRRHYRSLLPLYPWAMSRMSLEGCDLVVSVSHCAAKAALAPEGVPHVCYCLTPARYLYDQSEAYLSRVPAPVRWAARAMLGRLREWDQRTAWRVTHFIAISDFIAARIREVYQRPSDVVYPPVDTDYFTPAPEGKGDAKGGAGGPARGDFFLTVSANAPNKRLDVAVAAFNRLGWPLTIVGPRVGKLRRVARSNITLRPWVGRGELRELYRRARGFVFTSIEDFGITPVEAQACGCPVIAFGEGGATETVVAGRTGILYEEQTMYALIDALHDYRPEDFDPAEIRRNAERFSANRFREEFLDVLRRVLGRKT